MNVWDRITILIGSVILAVGLYAGAAVSAESKATVRDAQTFTAVGVAGLASAPRTVDGNLIEPVAVRLPAGVRVDPSTGLLVGVRLKGDKDTTPAPWELFRSYDYQKGLEGMPESIRDLHEKKVVMLGFLWAIYEPDDIRRFGLVGSHWSCCYGVPPGLSDVVMVELKEGEDGLSQTLNPIRVVGTLHIREEKQGGFTTAIYHMTDAVVQVLEY